MIRTENPYIYKPGNQIRRDLAESAKGIDAAANQIVEKKKADYAQIAEIHDKIDLLAEDFNNQHADFLNAKVSEIEKLTADSVKKRGRVDYAQLGDVNKRIRSLKQMQNNSKNAVQTFKDNIAKINSNPAYVNNPVELAAQMEVILRSPEALESPLNIGAKMEDLYSSDINYVKLVKDKIKKTLDDRGDVVTEKKVYFDREGNELTAIIETYPNFTKWNPVTNRVEQEKITLTDGSIVGAVDALKKDLLKGKEAEGYDKYVIGSNKATGVSMDESLGSLIGNFVASGVKSSEVSRTKAVVEKARLDTILVQGKVEKLKYELATQDEVYKVGIAKIEAETRAIGERIIISRLNLGIAAKKAGQTIVEFKLDAKKDGWIEQKDGSMIYDETKDINQSNKIKVKEAASTVNNIGLLGKIEAAKGPSTPATVSNGGLPPRGSQVKK